MAEKEAEHDAVDLIEEEKKALKEAKREARKSKTDAKKKSKPGRKTKRRPQTAQHKKPTPPEGAPKKPRPESAPARLTKRLPVKTYASQYQAEVRALPDPPKVGVSAKTGGKLGHHNSITSDQKLKDPPQRKPPVEDGPEPEAEPTPRLTMPEDHRMIEFTGTVVVRLSATTQWANVRYTLDGGPVDVRSRVARRPIEISQHCLLRCASLTPAREPGVSENVAEIVAEMVRRPAPTRRAKETCGHYRAGRINAASRLPSSTFGRPRGTRCSLSPSRGRHRY